LIKAIRQFIRHPADIPIQASLNTQEIVGNDDDVTLTNIGLGGLAFQSTEALDSGEKAEISIPALEMDSRLSGTVVWCREAGPGLYEIGLRFDDSESLYRMRMIEQVCHIEHYRRQVLEHENRELTANQAAKEWISRYAGDFPAL